MTVTICKNAVSTIVGGQQVLNGATSISVTLSGSITQGTYYNKSADFAVGDKLSVFVQTSSASCLAADLGVQVDLF